MNLIKLSKAIDNREKGRYNATILSKGAMRSPLVVPF